MSTVNGIRSMPIEKIDEADLKCPITHLRDSQVAVCDPCLHIFSRIALEISFRQDPKCPLCRQRVEKIVSPKELRKELIAKLNAYDKTIQIHNQNSPYLRGNREERQAVEIQRIGHYFSLEPGDLPRLFSGRDIVEELNFLDRNVRAELRFVMRGVADIPDHFAHIDGSAGTTMGRIIREMVLQSRRGAVARQWQPRNAGDTCCRQLIVALSVTLIFVAVFNSYIINRRGQTLIQSFFE